MLRILLLVFSLLISISVSAEDQAVEINGERFSKTFIGKPPNGDQLIEFINESETFQNWTKLIAYRYQQLPKINNVPKQAAVTMYKIAKANYPGTKAGILLNKNETDAIAHFFAWPRNGEQYIEFNIFRYKKSRDNNAVVSLQVAYRMQLTKDPEQVRKQKETQVALLNSAAKYDMNLVQNKIEELLSNSDKE